MGIINIKEPYYTAGKKYRWSGKPIGLGIDLKLLDGGGILEVTVGASPKVWQIDKKMARDFVRERDSYYQARGTMLGVIAWSKFTAKEEKPSVIQQKLL